MQSCKSHSVESFSIVEGRIIWNLTEFEGFYGLEDSLVQSYKETINHYLKIQEETSEAKNFRVDYDFLKKNNLLFTPCKFIVTNNNKRLRIHFSEKDAKEINQTNWLNKNKKEKKHAFLKMETTQLKEGTFFCDKLMSINLRRLDDN